MVANSLTIPDILGENGQLVRSSKGFEYRSSQMEMALLVEDALEKELPAVAEAGTGTGKTFGYLVPLILSGKKAVVSTGTKNLQEQIYFKDIPLLEKNTGLKTDAMMMKGRKNYLCLHRYYQHFGQESFLKSDEVEIREKIEGWMATSEFGDMAELEWMPEDNALRDILTASSDQCLGGKCPHYDDCFIGKLRAKAARSSLIIVNHYLFFADLKLKEGGFGEIIPRFQAAVFDEAHRVEQVATAHLGERISTGQLTDLANELEKSFKGLERREKNFLKGPFHDLLGAIEKFKEIFSYQADKGRVDAGLMGAVNEGPGRDLDEALRRIEEAPSEGQIRDDMVLAIGAKAGDLRLVLQQMLHERRTQWLIWYEKRKRSVTIHASPLNVSQVLTVLLYSSVKAVVFTSATLSTNKSFEYIRSRLGIPGEALQGIYPSHFDFIRHTLFYSPKDLPNPGTEDFPGKAAERIKDILERSRGRALVLFTGYHNMNRVYDFLRDRVPYRVYKQGDAPRSALLERFRDNVHSVLMATGSFWQGVDVPGESLSCLIIDKLPFDSPGDPLVAARIDAIKEKGGNPFNEYQLPSAVISLKQGLGRLIRKSSDRGILAVLDGRITKSRYGKVFIESLPETMTTHELQDIERFFNEHPGAQER